MTFNQDHPCRNIAAFMLRSGSCSATTGSCSATKKKTMTKTMTVTWTATTP